LNPRTWVIPWRVRMERWGKNVRNARTFCPSLQRAVRSRTSHRGGLWRSSQGSFPHQGEPDRCSWRGSPSSNHSPVMYPCPRTWIHFPEFPGIQEQISQHL
jgi:hypothetical protein